MIKETTFVAFLRGINVGGNKMVKMSKLSTILTTKGFKNVRTLLVSGNVIFDSSVENVSLIKEQIEKAIQEEFGFIVAVLIRRKVDILSLVQSDPFMGISVTPLTRLYVTFLSQAVKSNLRIPYESKEKDFSIIKVTTTEVCTVLVLSGNRNTTDAMSIIEKEFGKNVTTRNWNTIVRIKTLLDEKSD